MLNRIILPYKDNMKLFGIDRFYRAVVAVLKTIGAWKVVDITMDRLSILRPGRGDLVFFLSVPTARTGRTLVQRLQDRGAKVAYYCMEPSVPSPSQPREWREGRARYRARIGRMGFDFLFDYNHVDHWRRYGLPAYLLPVGYHESYEVPDYVRSFPFPRSIHFLGVEHEPGSTEKDRRGKICDRIRELGGPCRSYSFRARIGRPATHAEEDENRLFISPGVHLNTHRVPAPFHFGGLRVVAMFLANARFVLSEPCIWSPPGLEPGLHWAVALDSELPASAVDWLRRPADCDAVGAAGYDFVRKHHRLDVLLPEAFSRAGILKG